MSETTHRISIFRNAEGDSLCTIEGSDSPYSTRIASPKMWGGSALLASIEVRESELVKYVQEECGAAPKGRSDQEIVSQTNALAHAFLSVLGFETDKDALLYESHNPRGLDAWDMAALAQEHLTDTDVEDAVASLETDQASAEPDESERYKELLVQLQVTVEKLAAGYRPGDEGWSSQDDEALSLLENAK